MTAPTLVERLGYKPDQRLLIVNCDDLGASHAANLGVAKAMREGIGSSASLMVPAPWARDAAEMTRGLPIGVHTTLTSEYAGYRWGPLSDGFSLREADGRFPATMEEALRRVTAEDARAECRAQIETALSWGVDVTHLDAHMNVMQKRHDLYDVFLDLAVEYQLAIRMFDRGDTDSQVPDARPRAAARGVLFNDHLVYPWPRPTCEVMVEAVPRLKPGVTELFAHPAADGEELRAYDRRHADIRAADVPCLTDPAVRSLLDRHRVKLISYRALRDLQRAAN